VDTNERRLAVLYHVLNEGFAEVSELARLFKCHVNSIRRDIENLEHRGDLIRLLSPDLAVSIVATFPSEILARRLETHSSEKWEVAKKALEFVEDGDSIFLSGGATNFLVALQIARSGKKGISVLAGTLYIQHFLRGIDRSSILGGRISRHAAVVESSADIDTLKQYHINKAFLGVDGLGWDIGAFCAKTNVTLQHSACMAASDLILFLTDDSEIGRVLPEGKFISFDELEEKSCNYKVVCNRVTEGGAKGARTELELARFSEGRVIWA